MWLLALAAALVPSPGARSGVWTRTRGVVYAAIDTDADWAALDAWLDEGAGRTTNEETLPPNRRWTLTSAGHVHESFYAKKSWQDAGAGERLSENVARLGYPQPSAVQVASFKPILEGNDVLLAYPSGMGKTLAFLGPVCQRLWELEAEHGRTPKGQVRAIILVPTNDLGQQVLEMARDVSNGKITATIATGEHKWQSQRKKLRNGVDLLVTTMGRLIAHLMPRDREPSFRLDGLRMLVVDEASSLYHGRLPSWLERQKREEGLEVDDEMCYLGEQPAVGRGVQSSHKSYIQGPTRAMWCILRSEMPDECATTLVTNALQEAVEDEMLSDFPSLRVIKSRGLHTTRKGVDVTLIDCSRGIWKPDEERPSLFEAKLAELRAALDDSRHALVLCNTDRSIERIEREIRNGPEGTGAICSGGVCVQRDVYAFHSSLTAETRAAALVGFRRTADGEAGDGGAAEHDGGDPRVLVATGRAVRGLDLSAGPCRPIDLVVLFDFAPDAKAYLARTGCATRGDAEPAKVTALAVRSQLKFARALMSNDQAGMPHALHAEEDLHVE